jgi:hypothetical protein
VSVYGYPVFYQFPFVKKKNNLMSYLQHKKISFNFIPVMEFYTKITKNNFTGTLSFICYPTSFQLNQLKEAKVEAEAEEEEEEEGVEEEVPMVVYQVRFLKFGFRIL